MKTFFIPVATLLLGLTFGYLIWERPRNVAEIPQTTPFDSDAQKRASYLEYFKYGYEWSVGNHVKCPPNSPIPGSEDVVMGWIDGFKKGVESGGTSDLPAKYVKYLKVDFGR